MRAIVPWFYFICLWHSFEVLEAEIYFPSIVFSPFFFFFITSLKMSPLGGGGRRSLRQARRR